MGWLTSWQDPSDGHTRQRQSAHELRVGLQIDDFELQHVLDGLLQTGVLRAAARQRDAVGGAGLLGHDEAALGNCHLDAGSDLVGRLPSPTRVMTSDSAKTVHCAVMGMTFFADRDRFENSGRLISKERAMARRSGRYRRSTYRSSRSS